MTIGIYIITNEITKKQYIGQSVHIKKRINEHKRLCDIQTSYIEKSILKYGWENFSWDILYECNEEYLDEEERKFINLYGTYGGGYNLTRGGELNGLGNPMRNPDCVKKNMMARKDYRISDETKLKISKAKNKTGFYRVFREHNKKLKQGFCYRYDYDNRIRSVSIRKLKEKVLANNLPWIIVNEELAIETLAESDYYTCKMANEHPTGYYRVCKCKDKNYTEGYYYRYNHFENGKRSNVQSTTIDNLKDKVLAKGWEWIKLRDNLDYEWS